MMLKRTASLPFAAACLIAIATMPAHAQPAGTYGAAPGYTTPQGPAAYGAAPSFTAPQGPAAYGAASGYTAPQDSVPRANQGEVHNQQRRAKM